MRINIKEQELIQELFDKVREKYPEIIFKDLSNSPDDPEHIWVNVIAPMDEEREIEMDHYAAELETDILLNYGYRISIMTENPNLIL